MRDIPISELPAEMARLKDRLANASLADTLRDCLPALRAGFRENFNRAAGPGGAAWPPRKDTKPHPLLNESGALIGATQGGAGGVTQIEDRQLAVSIDRSVRLGGIPGAAVHQFGYPPRNIPPRPYYYASEETLDQLTDQFADGALVAIFGD
jgi:phage gpG-like protein